MISNTGFGPLDPVKLISFIQDRAQSVNKNIQTDIMIMDFVKAFHNVSHAHLLYKLSFYGINNNALHWISDFLNQRTQAVVPEGEKSDTISVTSGVPQGTVLGPILFLVYINDFHEYLKHSTLRLFRDGSIIYKKIHSINDARELQEDLEAAARWEQDWLMCFHPNKMQCPKCYSETKTCPIYKLHGHSLEKQTLQSTLVSPYTKS